MVLQVAEQQGVYPLTTWKPTKHAAGATHVMQKPLTRMEAHERLCHIAHSTVEIVVKNNSIEGFDVDLMTPIMECQVCIHAKMKNLPTLMHREEPLGKVLGEHISTDLWGPAPSQAKGRYKYFSTHLDAATDIAWISLQKSKESAETLRNYKHWVQIRGMIDCVLRNVPCNPGRISEDCMRIPLCNPPLFVQMGV